MLPLNLIPNYLNGICKIRQSRSQADGFVAAEAKQLLEFCIELNNQDDRGKSSDPQYEAKPGSWKIVFDSRHPGNTEWNKKWPLPANAPDPNNPESNGFGPFNNAWLLLKSEIDPTQYAIAIRGTVGETRSIIADALITTTSVLSGIKLREGRLLPITFAATPKAELHLGLCLCRIYHALRKRTRHIAKVA